MNEYLFYAILLIVVVFFLFNKKKKSTEVAQIITEGGLVIDVRTQREFNSRNFPESINIPLNLIENNIDKIKSFKNNIVVVCASGIRSSSGCSILKKNGVSCMNGGLWSSLR